jgi:hypothetical protein
MIVELIMALVFTLLSVTINMIPDFMVVNADFGMLVAFLSRGFIIFPPQVWVIAITNIVFWLGVQMWWAIIEWVYNKIPGVN